MRPVDEQLFKAVSDSDAQGILEALRAGANVHATSDLGTPMVWQVNDEVTLRVLLEHGAGIDARSRGSTYLNLAVTFSFDVTELLIRYGADVNARDPRGRTPLFRAVTFGQSDTIDLLIKSGANINAQGSDGSTPLHEASTCGKYSIVEQLLSRGADPNVQNGDGDTPLVLAIMWEKSWKADIIALFGAHGANVNIENPKDYCRPIHYAASNGQTDVVRRLHLLGADLTARTRRGNTPVALAVRGNHRETARLLRTLIAALPPASD